MLVPWFASIFEPLYIAWAGIKFEVFRRGGPKLQRANLFFLWPRRLFFLKLKGNIIPDPPDTFSTCGECLLNVMGGLRSRKLYVS